MNVWIYEMYLLVPFIFFPAIFPGDSVAIGLLDADNTLDVLSESTDVPTPQAATTLVLSWLFFVETTTVVDSAVSLLLFNPTIDVVVVTEEVCSIWNSKHATYHTLNKN